VSHAVDAHNLPPGPEAHGLVVLEPGTTLSTDCRFRVREIECTLNAPRYGTVPGSRQH
jgi:hypothetical protein